MVRGITFEAMSQVVGVEQQRLEAIAEEVREQFAADGHLVGTAVDLHPAFNRSRRPGRSLTRELIMDAVSAGAARAGMHLEPVTGGGLDLVSQDGATYRRYRLRSATPRRDGTFRIPHNGDSALAEPSGDLFQSEQWVFGYTLTAAYGLGALFVAQVVGVLAGNPGTLILGDPLLLTATSTPPPDFTAPEEDLDGFETDQDRAEDKEGEKGQAAS